MLLCSSSSSLSGVACFVCYCGPTLRTSCRSGHRLDLSQSAPRTGTSLRGQCQSGTELGLLVAVGLAFVGHRNLKGHRVLGRGESTWWRSGRLAAAAGGGGLGAEEDCQCGAAYLCTRERAGHSLSSLVQNLSQAAGRIAALSFSSSQDSMIVITSLLGSASLKDADPFCSHPMSSFWRAGRTSALPAPGRCRRLLHVTIRGGRMT